MVKCVEDPAGKRTVDELSRQRRKRNAPFFPRRTAVDSQVLPTALTPDQ